MVIDPVAVRRIQGSGPPPDDHDWAMLEWCLSNHDDPERWFANTARLSPRFHVIPARRRSRVPDLPTYTAYSRGSGGRSEARAHIHAHANPRTSPILNRRESPHRLGFT